jgi:mannan endo-1,4-beta-mannosidase
VACADPDLCEPAAVPPPLVGVDGALFLADDGPFLPRGVNSYPLLDHAGRGRLDDIDEILALAVDLGRPVIRTGAHMTGGTNPARLRDDDGTIREEGLEHLDLVVEMAEARGVQLLLVTSNHWSDYGGAPAVLRAVASGEDLPVEAFYSDERAVEHQRAYLTALATRINSRTGRRYASDETIFAWELTNEARCADGDLCGERTLERWARTMARALRDAGAVQPIAWGGQGFLDEYGEDLARIATVDEVDVLTVHLYPDHYGAQTLEPGAGIDRIPAAVQYGVDFVRDAAQVARAHDKALLVEEAGWRTESTSGDRERAFVLAAWARVAATEGAGFFPWMIAERDRPDYDGYLIRPEREPVTDAVLRCE